jgi:hypothetical protein
MDVVTGWTGRTACALQAALRMSNDVFAAHLDIGARTVADWHQKPGLRPRPDTQQLLDTALARATPEAAGRFAILTGQSSPAASARRDENGAAADAEHRLITDGNISGALGRLDLLAGWDPGTARRQVAARLTALDRRDLLDRASRRRRIGRRAVADALGAYYRGQAGEHGRYGAHCGHDGTEVVTSILTRPEWLDLGCALTADHDRLTLAGAAGGDLPLDATAADAAVQRLAEILVAGTRFVDMPLYRLAGIDAGKGQISGSLGITQFASYALTLDLLEGELSDALTAGVSPEPGLLPLRDRYLPDLASVLDVADRLCAGGPLALSAFARPADPCRGPADYVLLVQERSGSVVNAARQLAVIPKGFHQPLADFRGDAKIAATLRREMEEELFGREDIDNTIITERNAADPMHPARLSAPMRWLLTENPGALRMECTGFGLNLVSGNFEFASLIVVDSDDFWHRFGGQIEASWESSSLRQYSSLDSGSLAALAHDDAWSNEGLFAFLQGLRRLSQVGGDRVDMPAIDWMVRP